MQCIYPSTKGRTVLKINHPLCYEQVYSHQRHKSNATRKKCSLYFLRLFYIATSGTTSYVRSCNQTGVLHLTGFPCSCWPHSKESQTRATLFTKCTGVDRFSIPPPCPQYIPYSAILWYSHIARAPTLLRHVVWTIGIDVSKAYVAWIFSVKMPDDGGNSFTHLPDYTAYIPDYSYALSVYSWVLQSTSSTPLSWQSLIRFCLCTFDPTHDTTKLSYTAVVRKPGTNSPLVSQWSRWYEYSLKRTLTTKYGKVYTGFIWLPFVFRDVPLWALTHADDFLTNYATISFYEEQCYLEVMNN